MSSYLGSIRKQFAYYRQLGERAMAQLDEEQLNFLSDPEANSVATIVQHLSGNMLSRFTDFRSSDGEKEWRQREAEFDNSPRSRVEIQTAWEKGWACLGKVLTDLTEDDLEELVYIRNQGHTIIEALNRQAAHYAYHIGQIVLLARQLKGTAFTSLSIPRGGSAAYNAKKFAQEKQRGHFSDEWLKKE